MKRYGNLWDRFLGWDNLLLAARKARRGKRSRPVVRRFEFHRELHLRRLQEELAGGSYRPGPYTTHTITRPKPRLISAAPYRDRVVHHALMNVLEPILERHFHPDSYACRRGKGAHAASRRLQQLMRRNRFAAACDVQKFFPSIDHAILKATFRRRVKDERLLAVMDVIVDHSNRQESVVDWYPGDDLFAPVDRARGLPIGNLTSQWFANWYLDGLDHAATGRTGSGGYVRYCDDFVLLAGARGDLRAALAGVRDHLAARRLRLHPGRTAVVPVQGGLTFVGYRTWATHRRLPKANVRRMRRRLEGPCSLRRIAGWLGHARQADSRRLLRRILEGHQ